MQKIDFSLVHEDTENAFGPYYNSFRIAPPIYTSSTSELNFKLAACRLIFKGIYPSGRQILNELGRTGRTKGRKCNLNGQECQWKADIFQIFKIKPYFGYTKRFYRKDWEETLEKFEFLYERDSHGKLVEIKHNDESPPPTSHLRSDTL